MSLSSLVLPLGIVVVVGVGAVWFMRSRDRRSRQRAETARATIRERLKPTQGVPLAPIRSSSSASLARRSTQDTDAPRRQRERDSSDIAFFTPPGSHGVSFGGSDDSPTRVSSHDGGGYGGGGYSTGGGYGGGSYDSSSSSSSSDSGGGSSDSGGGGGGD